MFSKHIKLPQTQLPKQMCWMLPFIALTNTTAHQHISVIQATATIYPFMAIYPAVAESFHFEPNMLVQVEMKSWGNQLLGLILKGWCLG